MAAKGLLCVKGLQLSQNYIFRDKDQVVHLCVQSTLLNITFLLVVNIWSKRKKVKNWDDRLGHEKQNYRECNKTKKGSNIKSPIP